MIEFKYLTIILHIVVLQKARTEDMSIRLPADCAAKNKINTPWVLLVGL